MNKKTSKEDNTVIMSDKYLSESGVQGEGHRRTHSIRLLYRWDTIIAHRIVCTIQYVTWFFPYKYCYYNFSTISYCYWFVNDYWWIFYL